MATERYIVTRKIIPPREADVFNGLPDRVRESIAEIHPAEQIGMTGSYSIDLGGDDTLVKRFQSASNLVDLLKVSDYPLGAARPSVGLSSPLGPDIEHFDLPEDPEVEIEKASSLAAYGAAAPPLERYWTIGPTLNQEKEGSCTGHSATHWLNAAPIMSGPYDHDFAVEVYNRAKDLDPWEGTAYEGTDMHAALAALTERGLIEDVRETTSIEEQNKYVLNEGGLMLVSAWYEGMYVPNSEGYIRPTGKLTGYHAYFQRGLSRWRSKRIQNSWSDSWGYRGLAWISDADARWMAKNADLVAYTAKQVKE